MADCFVNRLTQFYKLFSMAIMSLALVVLLNVSEGSPSWKSDLSPIKLAVRLEVW